MTSGNLNKKVLALCWLDLPGIRRVRCVVRSTCGSSLLTRIIDWSVHFTKVALSLLEMASLRVSLWLQWAAQNPWHGLEPCVPAPWVMPDGGCFSVWNGATRENTTHDELLTGLPRFATVHVRLRRRLLWHAWVHWSETWPRQDARYQHCHAGVAWQPSNAQIWVP